MRSCSARPTAVNRPCYLLAAILTSQQKDTHRGHDLKQPHRVPANTWHGRTGFLPQKLALAASLSVPDNLLLAAYTKG
jgi:hypothetical protein